MVRAKKINKNVLKFPLIEQAEIAETDLFSKHQEYVVPEYIDSNLTHTLRSYQNKAIRNYHYTQTEIKPSPQHVLFNMATGSGKTDLMAGLIIYLYQEQGYQNFLFTVNTNSVLMKTKDNLVNQKSNKYLFQPKIEIDGQIITIKDVDRFPKIQQPNTIYIKLSSVQKVSDDLFNVKEGMMGLSDYKRQPVAILADEAHHYSASTKKQREDDTWESAINKIVGARDDKEAKNILLEFTATVDFEKEEIYNKYQNKVVYRYALNKFMADGFSKQVKRIETSASDIEKMLNVVLLSQYRKYFAQSENVTGHFKPIIMFKSPKVAISMRANMIFNDLIANLNVADLVSFIHRQQLLENDDSSALELAYKFYLKNEERLSDIIREIKNDFDPRNVLNVNDASGNMLEKGQYNALNTLESPNNLYRVVFAVAKLTEGWDVLNLYDIVRINEEAATNKGATMVEAQLVGRGARYYPFEIKGEKSYKRRFDNDLGNRQLLLETLHYHTMNEPQYLKQLVSSLEQMDLPTGKDKKNPPIEVRIKSSFKRTNIYKKGKIYYNESVEVPDSYFNSLEKYGILHREDITRSLHYGSREIDYKILNTTIETKQIAVPNFHVRYIKKAIQRLEFYQFNNLKKYIPLLSSMYEFIYGCNWLNANNLTLYLTVPKNYHAENLSPDEILQVVVDLLKEYQIKIKSGYVKKRGTNKFVGYPISDYLTSYNKRIPVYDNNNLFDITQKVLVEEIPEDFYVYEKAIVNRLESNLIVRIKEHIDALKSKYGKEVYLFRMDENMHRESIKGEKLKLHQFGHPVKNDGITPSDTHLSGFQPDFILFMEDSDNFYFQIFIEPKGMSGERFESERWKEELLTYMTQNQGELEFSDDETNIQVKGLKFFTKNDGQQTMKQLREMTGITSKTVYSDYDIFEASVIDN